MNHSLNRSVATAVTTGVVLALGTAAPAHADGGVDVDVTGGPLHLEDLVPGGARSGGFVIDNRTEGPAVVSFDVVVVDQKENGCLEPESEVDPTCGSSGGELGDWLTMRITRDGTEVWTGPVGELVDGAVVGRRLPAGGTWDLGVAVELPAEAGNEVMGDRVLFDLRVSAVAGDDDDSEVVPGDGSAGGGGSTGGADDGAGDGAAGASPTAGGSGDSGAGTGVPISGVDAGLDGEGEEHLVESGRAWLVAALAALLTALAGVLAVRHHPGEREPQPRRRRRRSSVRT